jgi:hypothetical protein
MVWPSPVYPGGRIYASQYNDLLSTFSTWADSLNVAIFAQGAALTFNGAATFAGAATFNGTSSFNAAATFAAAATFSAAAAFNGSTTFNQPMSVAGGNIGMVRPASFNNNGASWSLTMQNASASDNLAFGQTGANYTVSGAIGWAGNSNVFLYFNSGQDFRIGAGFGSTPALTVKGSSNGRILINTLTDNATDQLQVNGSVFANGLNVSTPANITLGSGWLTWSPTITAFGSMTVSGVSITDGQYLRFGPLVYCKLYVTLTLGGTTSNVVFATLPVTLSGNISAVACAVKTAGGLWNSSWGFADPTGNLLKIQLNNEANFPLGSTQILVSFFYRCA